MIKIEIKSSVPTSKSGQIIYTKKELLWCPDCKKQTVDIVRDGMILGCLEQGVWQETTRLEQWSCDFFVPLNSRLYPDQVDAYNRFVEENLIRVY